ncbi:hypothetical protein [Streptomyces sp. MW-W600-10]|uniref:hypothetical protein n=1 Tax=Streptomyces sp. MW-W600-10 TaxID=2829819 RepID=UPI001C43BE1E|nr:hypothetical protein [Streptomyces sp. MW-W600-10]MBV7249283.1 hypothetical protein [Streptomyces sp. MW-W600-10]
MNTRRLTRTAAMVRRHYTRVRGQVSDAGYSVTEWVFITAGGGAIAGMIYLAIDGTAQRKAAEILGL